MTAASIEGVKVQRFSRRFPCLACAGHPDAVRGKGVRCHGFVGSDGRYFRCSREEAAGALSAGADGLFLHIVEGPCRCGATHKAKVEPLERAHRRSAEKPRTERSFESPEAAAAAFERGGRELDAVYVYEHAAHVPLIAVLRLREADGGKTFRQVSHKDGKWVIGTKGVDLVPYRLPELREAIDGRDTVYVVEGEKDVAAIEAAGFPATCNPMGAGKDVKPYAKHFEGADVVRIVADRDEVGRKHAQAWAESLDDMARVVEILEPVDGKDAHDALIVHGLTLEKAFRQVDAESPSCDTATDDDFEPLQQIRDRYGPDFPVALLPDGVREMVESASVAVQVPSSAIGVMALATLSFGVCRVFEAVPRPGFREPLNLFGIAALPPATRKSATIRLLAAPIAAFERERNEETQMERELCEGRVRRLEKRLTAVEKAFANAKGDDATDTEGEAVSAAAELREARSALAAVAKLRLYTSDVTPEASAALMARNGERLAIISAEGDEFFGLMRRYAGDGRANQDFWLKAHAGDPARVDRRSGESLDLEAPALALVLAVQPSVIDAIREDAEMRNRGMTARFLYAVPEPTVGRREIDPPPIPTHVTERYERVVKRLLSCQGVGIPLPFSPEANAALRAFETELEPRLAEDADLGPMATWAGKLVGLVVRISGIFHAADMVQQGREPNDREVTEETVTRSIGVGLWALDHAAVALSNALEGDSAAARLWRWVIGRDDPAADFAARDVFNATKRKGETMETMTRPGIRALVDRGYLRELPRPEQRKRGGRPPSPRYEPNPRALEAR